MKVIIAGSRPPADARASPTLLQRWYAAHEHSVVDAVAASKFRVTEVVCGKAHGFDTLGERWAEKNGLLIKPFPAKWRSDLGLYNPMAGHERNKQMADYADALIAVWNGESSGTANMLMTMHKAHKPVYVHRYKD